MADDKWQWWFGIIASAAVVVALGRWSWHAWRNRRPVVPVYEEGNPLFEYRRERGDVIVKRFGVRHRRADPLSIRAVVTRVDDHLLGGGRMALQVTGAAAGVEVAVVPPQRGGAPPVVFFDLAVHAGPQATLGLCAAQSEHELVIGFESSGAIDFIAEGVGRVGGAAFVVRNRIGSRHGEPTMLQAPQLTLIPQ